METLWLATSEKGTDQPSVDKIVLTVFWDQHTVVMTDFVAKDPTITGINYALLLKKLPNTIKPESWGMLNKKGRTPEGQRSSS